MRLSLAILALQSTATALNLPLQRTKLQHRAAVAEIPSGGGAASSGGEVGLAVTGACAGATLGAGAKLRGACSLCAAWSGRVPGHHV